MNIKEVKFLCDTIMMGLSVFAESEKNLYEITDCDDYIATYVKTDDDGNIVAWCRWEDIDRKYLYQEKEQDNTKWQPFNYEKDLKEWCVKNECKSSE